MLNMPIEEIKAQLLTVNTAIQDLILGKRLSQLRVGSSTFSRLYTYSEVMLDELKAHRKELLQALDEIENRLPTFRSHATIPTFHCKQI